MGFITSKEAELLCFFLSPGRSKMIFNGEEIRKGMKGEKKKKEGRMKRKEGSENQGGKRRVLGMLKEWYVTFFSLTNCKWLRSLDLSPHEVSKNLQAGKTGERQ